MDKVKRTCGDCTKCCEGYLLGEVNGKTFYPGKPCHFLGKGCTIYSKRPVDPCQTYRCEWLTNEEIPEWMKPSEVNAIIDIQEQQGIKYLRVKEAGAKLDSKVLSWIIRYVLVNQLNLLWEVDGGQNWIGRPDFNALMAGLRQA